MREQIERGLVELITNSDDSYRDLEEKGKKSSGKIRIEIERRKKGQPSVVIIRDRAGGMSGEDMYHKLGILGRRTSGFEKGKARRGLHGRGARDVAAFGTVHFQSIKGGEYSHLTILPSLKCRFESRAKRVSDDLREKLHIPKGNGTVVTIEVDGRFKVPLHETLRENFSRYYSLRDIFSSPDRKVKLADLNKGREDPLTYKFPSGEVVFEDDCTIRDYPDTTAHLIIRKHKTAFEQEGSSPHREGILVRSSAAVHDCTLFELESDPYSRRFTGELNCEYIDKLVREYDDREDVDPDKPDHPKINPSRLLDPFRDGLMLDHPFAQALYSRAKEILKPLIEELKDTEAPPKREVTDEDLEKKLNSLSKEISKVFENKLKELEEEIPLEDMDKPEIKGLGIGLHIIPPGDKYPIPITVDQPKTFSTVVNHYEPLDESLPVTVSSEPDDIRVRTSPVFLKKFSENRRTGSTTFIVESSKTGVEGLIEVRYSGYDNYSFVNVIEPPPSPAITGGLSFEKPLYHLRINREKTLLLRLKISGERSDSVIATVVSDHPEIKILKGGGRCRLRKTEAPGVLTGRVRVIGQQLMVRGTINAHVEGFKTAETRVVVEQREPSGGIRLEIKAIEEDFRPVRYKWDSEKPHLLLIGAKHPSIRKYLGEPTEADGKYSGIKSTHYHIVLAEVIAEALAFRVLERQFVRIGQEGMLDYASTDAYFHKHFSEFLPVAHKNLVTESIGK
jgi:hypothetical protein